MRQATSKSPIASFTVAPHAPPKTAATIKRFDQVSDAWAACRGEIGDAKQAAIEAREAAKRNVVDAAKSGKSSTVSIVAVEAEHAEHVAVLEAKAEALATAVDEAGNEMAAAIAQDRDAWLEGLATIREALEQRFAAIVKEAQAILVELAPARGAVEWLENFHAGYAQVGRQQQFSGGRIRIDGSRLGRLAESELDPLHLLKLLAQVSSPAPAPKTTRHHVRAR